jgi:hypothetical protein
MQLPATPAALSRRPAPVAIKAPFVTQLPRRNIMIIHPNVYPSAGISGRRIVAAATAVGLALSLTGSAGAATYSTSPGKNSAFEASTADPLTVYSSKLTATIVKGKKGTVLAMEAGYTDGPYGPIGGVRAIAIGVTVNGIAVQPNPAAVEQHTVDCGMTDTPPAICTVVGTFWFDIDAAELANPGMFVGQPLTVVLSAGDVSGGAFPANPMDSSLSVRVQKK